MPYLLESSQRASWVLFLLWLSLPGLPGEMAGQQAARSRQLPSEV